MNARPTNPKTVPDKCDLEILIDEMELVFSVSRCLYAQSIRAVFHDAGTFDRNNNEDGSNGCLLNKLAMHQRRENNGLDLPLNVLQVISLNYFTNSFVFMVYCTADNV